MDPQWGIGKCNIQFDINTFYPKISKKLVTKAIDYARQFTTITNQQKKIIIQSSRDILINNGEIWVKKGDADKFSVTMGSFSGAEVCELVGLYLLHLITTTLKVPKKLIGLYRDDGLLVTSARPRQVETLRKKLCELFPKVGLSIEAHANLNTVDFLDVTFNLSMDTYKPFMKPGDYPRYVDLPRADPPHAHTARPDSRSHCSRVRCGTSGNRAAASSRDIPSSRPQPWHRRSPGTDWHRRFGPPAFERWRASRASHHVPEARWRIHYHYVTTNILATNIWAPATYH